MICDRSILLRCPRIAPPRDGGQKSLSSVTSSRHLDRAKSMTVSSRLFGAHQGSSTQRRLRYSLERIDHRNTKGFEIINVASGDRKFSNECGGCNERIL
jgi:queuine/archaeosine tRNA-ribosyltransferase